MNAPDPRLRAAELAAALDVAPAAPAPDPALAMGVLATAIGAQIDQAVRDGHFGALQRALAVIGYRIELRSKPQKVNTYPNRGRAGQIPTAFLDQYDHPLPKSRSTRKQRARQTAGRS